MVLALAASLALVSPVADRVWGEPSCGTPIVRAAHGEELHGGDDGLAGADPATCTIVLSREALRLPRAPFCHLILHERGHLAGIEEHSHNERSVMYAEMPLDRRISYRHGHLTVVYPYVDRRCR